MGFSADTQGAVATGGAAGGGASGSATAPPALVARGLTRRFGELTAVESVDLAIERGAIFGLVGPDGAGKSTLIRMIATVLSPDAGDAEVFGASVVGDAQAVKPRIGYMSQRFSLYGDLTVRENVDFFAQLRGVPRDERRERAQRALEFAGLSEFQRRQAQFLSGGMKQKLALAVTLMHEPDLLLLDEPTTGVDPVSRREFWRIIADLHRRGITVLVATPYMDEAERCTTLAFMDRGRILLSDTPAALKQRVPGRLFEVFVSDPRASMPALRAMPHVRFVTVFGESLRVLTAENGPDAEGLRAAIAQAGLGEAKVTPARMDMEVAFSYLVAEQRGGQVSVDA